MKQPMLSRYAPKTAGALLLLAACSSDPTKTSLTADASTDARAPVADGSLDADGAAVRDGGRPPDEGDASTSHADASDASNPDATPTNPYLRDLLGYWPFDGDGADRSGGARSLTLVGAPTFATGVFGSGLALVGNGNQYATRSVSDSAFDLNASDFTISVWVRFNSAAPEQALVEKFDGQMGPGFSLVKLGTGEAHFWSRPSAVVTSDPLALAALVWHHFLVRRAGSAFAVFVDGASVATGASAVAVSATSMPLLVGRRNVNDGRVMAVDGTLDDLALWSRALDDAEVRGLWASGSGRAVVP